MGIEVKFKVSLDLHLDEEQVEHQKKLARAVRYATIEVWQKALLNLYSGVYAAPEDPKRPRTGALVNSLYVQMGDGSIDESAQKQGEAVALNPKAEIAEPDFTPAGELEGKVGVAVGYGVYMEAYKPFLEPAAIEVQEDIVSIYEKS